MSREAEHSAEVSGPPEIKPEEIVLEELIGSGSFGKVYRGRCRSKAVAVKILHKQQFDPQTLAAFRKEVYLMSKIYHPNVCLFMGACTIPGKCMIVTELVAKGNYEVLLHDEKSNIPLWLRLRMARDAALGVNWLHESTPTFIHRDLKSSNLLVDENFRVKICDFGLSCVKQRHQMLKDQTSAKGTPLYMAPEVMMFREFNESSDVYSFGIVLWEILTRKEPFSQFRALDAFREAVCIRHERPPIPPDTLESLKRLIERCWDKDPSHRPNFRELIVMLDHVAIEAAISDKRGREFWKKYFLTESVVPWDLFIDNFCDFLKIPNKTAAEKNTVPFFNIKCIQALLADNPHQEGSNTSGKVVSMEKFGKILEYFGPMDSPNFLDNLRETLAQKWFHGDTDTADAAAILSSQPPGSFLVRFSNTNAGCFTISQVSVDSTVRHQRVQHVIGKGFQFQNILFPTLQELVANTLNVALSCPNYKYMAIFVDAAVGYPLDGRAYG